MYYLIISQSFVICTTDDQKSITEQLDGQTVYWNSEIHIAAERLLSNPALCFNSVLTEMG